MGSKSVLLIVGGGIAAYKSLELVRLLRKAGLGVRCILTRAGGEFVTPLSLAALSEEKVFSELFSLIDEAEMGHIQLSRGSDLIVVAPATADLMAKAANGIADDLASTTLLATDKPVIMAPAMNVRMWSHPATVRNFQTLSRDGVLFVGPDEGPMACGEFGPGRMSEPEAIFHKIQSALGADLVGPLSGKRALVTAGPTLEPIDPVRFLSNRSSGKQGYAIAGALAELGAEVTLVSGPVALKTPTGVRRVDIESARDMLAACEASLPVDIAVLAAAVADWRPEAPAELKVKKSAGGLSAIRLVENPDILATLSQTGPMRPGLVVGFAAETHDLDAHARAKLARKGCDWIIGNDVSGDVMGSDENDVRLYAGDSVEHWPRAQKQVIGERLAAKIAATLQARS